MFNHSTDWLTTFKFVKFSPDGKWVIFRSNMFGPAYVFTVEVASAQ